MLFLNCGRATRIAPVKMRCPKIGFKFSVLCSGIIRTTITCPTVMCVSIQLIPKMSSAKKRAPPGLLIRTSISRLGSRIMVPLAVDDTV